MVSARTLSKIAIAVCILSLLLQLLGISCPGWMIIAIDLTGTDLDTDVKLSEFGEVVSECAVWYVRVCVNVFSVSTCTSTPQHDSRHMGLDVNKALPGLAEVNWVEVEIELTVALIFGCIGTGLVIASLFGVKISGKVLTSIASACMLISGVMSLPAAVQVGLSIQDTKTAIVLQTAGKGRISVRTPWALALSATGLIFALMGCLLLIVTSCKQNEQTSAVIAPSDRSLSPVILKMGDFPLAVSNITLSVIENHITQTTLPSTTSNMEVVPPIVTRDDESVTREKDRCARESSFFDPCMQQVISAPIESANHGHLHPLEEFLTDKSESSIERNFN